MTASGIISAIFIGAIIGALARLILPGRQPIGLLLTIAIGIIASVVGTAIAQKVGVATTDGVDWIELVFQIGLAVIGVAAASALMRKRAMRR
ncbi:GlsB/YeaQ/YmgE family stress response membrane protein [Actinomadura roseirufa]|uniref:GlsB/YeaQ/YmgE family stress response membrane protein n=1 Tax=Actinomadura roseirufa TaxID=2094049 RepID=UPI001041921B|nr:GlsB/YeaQ/YmgE family stress response membrane protein [Actinomadura roseirufa]